LKQFKGDVSQPYMPFSLLTNEKDPLFQPVKVMDCQIYFKKWTVNIAGVSPVGMYA